MDRFFIGDLCGSILPALLGVMLCAFPAFAENASDDEKGVDVLAHGPIHEAFAETIAYDPEPGIIVPKAPPERIKELPPDQKPEGDVEWIPGYWGWDDDRNDFVWVSGTWRAVPPGRQWIPGYWTNSQGGYQWISGYWAPEENNTATYLPEPPESVEVGPNVNAPSPNYSWIPGCWIWYSNAYAWRPGYWAAVRPDWMWVPAHYMWTPRGYVFVGGYWDFPIGSRGVLFAPVAFGINVALGSGFYFTPSFMINVGVFSDCLFVGPRYHHYYFGDYYATRYYRKGIFPWFSPHVRRYGYDPIYAHQRWKHRNNPNWEKNLQKTYQSRRKDKAVRPPRTFSEQRKIQQESKRMRASGRSFKQPFYSLTEKRKDLPKFKTVSKNERTQIEQRDGKLRDFSKQRRKLESRGAIGTSTGFSQKMKVERVKFPESPIAAKRDKQTLEKKSVPNSHGSRQPNSKTPPVGKGVQKAPGSSERIDVERNTVPKSSASKSNTGRSSKPSGSRSKGNLPPAHYKTPRTDDTVQPLERRSSGRTVQTKSSSSGKPAIAPSKSKNRNAPQSNMGMEVQQKGSSGHGQKSRGGR